jgi:hypothetical protein
MTVVQASLGHSQIGLTADSYTAVRLAVPTVADRPSAS